MQTHRKMTQIWAAAAVLAAVFLLAAGMLPAAQAATYRQTFPMNTNAQAGGFSLYSLHSFYTTEGNSYFGYSSEPAFGQTVKYNTVISTSGNYALANIKAPSHLFGGNIYTLSSIHLTFVDSKGGVQSQSISCPSSDTWRQASIPDDDGRVRVQVYIIYKTGWFC